MDVRIRPAGFEDAHAFVEFDAIARRDPRRATFIRDAIDANRCSAAVVGYEIVGT